MKILAAGRVHGRGGKMSAVTDAEVYVSTEGPSENGSEGMLRDAAESATVIKIEVEISGVRQFELCTDELANVPQVLFFSKVSRIDPTESGQQSKARRAVRVLLCLHGRFAVRPDLSENGRGLEGHTVEIFYRHGGVNVRAHAFYVRGFNRDRLDPVSGVGSRQTNGESTLTVQDRTGGTGVTDQDIVRIPPLKVIVGLVPDECEVRPDGSTRQGEKREIPGHPIDLGMDEEGEEGQEGEN